MILIIAAFFLNTAHADLYFRHTRNEDLAAQFQAQPERLLPSTDLYSLGVDTYLFKPWVIDPPSSYYHGSGYWVNLFAEGRPHPDVALNLKLAAYNGASSFGYAQQNNLQPYFGLTWDPHFLRDDWKFHLRYGDLDRITLGAGLLLEAKEINGLLLTLKHDDFRYTGIVDGTGGFYVRGDLYSQAIDWRENLLAFSFTFINYDGQAHEVLIANDGSERVVELWGAPAWTLFSTHPLSPQWKYRTEVGLRNSKLAGLAGLNWATELAHHWSLSWGGQTRIYEKGFADQLAGYIQQEYLTPEILDKDYCDPRNILRYDDDTSVLGTTLKATYRPLAWLELGSSNELYSFRYREHGTNTGYFFKDAASVCPYPSSEQDCVSFFVGNKVVNEHRPAYAPGLAAISLISEFNFGIEAFLYF